MSNLLITLADCFGRLIMQSCDVCLRNVVLRLEEVSCFITDFICVRKVRVSLSKEGIELFLFVVYNERRFISKTVMLMISADHKIGSQEGHLTYIH